MIERRMLLGQMCRVTTSDLVSLVATNGLAKIVQNLRGSGTRLTVTIVTRRHAWTVAAHT